jgi:hypothetical protein
MHAQLRRPRVRLRRLRRVVRIVRGPADVQRDGSVHVHAELPVGPQLRHERRVRRAVHGVSFGAHVHSVDGGVHVRGGVLGLDRQLQGQLRVRQHGLHGAVSIEPNVQPDHGQLRLPHELQRRVLPERNALLPRQHLLHRLRATERHMQHLLTAPFASLPRVL